MCLSPIIIDNPNYNSPIRDPTYHLIHNTTDSKISVPCGRCSVCIHLKQIYLVQRVQMESLENDLFYGTLTYNNEMLPIAEYGDIKFAYPDISDWQKMIKLVRKNHPELKFKYLLVTEYGSKKHRPHYHFILSLPRSDVGTSLAEKISKAYDLFNIFLKHWRRNLGTTFNPIWKNLLTYFRRNGKYNYDLHYLDPNSSNDGLDGVSFYVTKYILKYDKWVDKFKSKLYFQLDLEDYKEAWSKLRPRILMSKGFGSPSSKKVSDHILSGIQLALDDPQAFYPYYVSRVNGATFPLSPYYQKYFMRSRYQEVFVSRRPIDDLPDMDVIDKQIAKFGLVQSFLFSQLTDFDYDEIDSINVDNIPKFYENAKAARFTEMASDFADCRQDFEFDCNSDS